MEPIYKIILSATNGYINGVLLMPDIMSNEHRIFTALYSII